MRILVEECSYDPSVLKGVLPEVDEKTAYLAGFIA